MSPELLLAGGLPLLAGAVGYGVLRQKVQQHDKALAEKASNDRVEGLRHTVETTQRTVERLEEKFDRFVERER